MATLYVRSTDGNNADNGTTWALAKATLAGVAAIDAAGDDIYVSQVHAESTAASISPAFAGTHANPVKIICGNDAAEPPTAVTTGATVATTGNAHITINGSVYVRGIAFTAGSTSALAYMLFGGTAADVQTYDNCSFILRGTNTGALISAGQSYTKVNWRDCHVKFADAAQGIAAFGDFNWDGGSVLSGGTSPTNLVKRSNAVAFANVRIANVDLSNCSAGVNIFQAQSAFDFGVNTISNSKLPASWSGALVSGTIVLGQRFSMYNCSSGATNYILSIMDYAGQIRDETTVVRTSGASDGTTPISWRMVSTANAKFIVPLVSDPIIVWNNTTGSAKTVTVEIVRDSATNLTDAEVWLEVDYYSTSGALQGTKITDAKANILATAADQTTSAAAWTTTGLGSPNTQKLSVSLTPQVKGYYVCRVALAKASSTVYVCPKVTVS